MVESGPMSSTKAIPLMPLAAPSVAQCRRNPGALEWWMVWFGALLSVWMWGSASGLPHPFDELIAGTAFDQRVGHLVDAFGVGQLLKEHG